MDRLPCKDYQVIAIYYRQLFAYSEMINSYFVDFDNTVWLRTGSNPAVTDRLRSHTGKDFLCPLGVIVANL